MKAAVFYEHNAPLIVEKLQIDALVSRRITLEDINTAFDWLEKGEVARSMILY